jgi:hypothetical protein
MGERCSMHVKGSGYKISVGKAERRRPLGITSRTWEDNITMDIREIGWEVVDWLRVAQDRDQWRALIDMVMNLLVK